MKRHGKQVQAMQEAVNAQKAEQEEAEAGLDKARTYLREKLGGSAEDVKILEGEGGEGEGRRAGEATELEALEKMDPQDMVGRPRRT